MDLKLLWIAFKIVFLPSIHTTRPRTCLQVRLWIAFKIVFLPSIHTSCTLRTFDFSVVNSFQNCIFTQHSHRACFLKCNQRMLWIAFKIVFLPSIHTVISQVNLHGQLWIAFKIVFLPSIHTAIPIPSVTLPVVNSFQNCIFTQHSHLSCQCICIYFVVNSFQNCIFTQHSHPWKIKHISYTLLWIAFKIVFLLNIPVKLSH